MSEYILEDITNFTELDASACYIVLFGVNNIPPHIGFVKSGKYFSKSTRGGKMNHDFTTILTSLRRKRVPVLFLQIGLDVEMPESYFDKEPLEYGESCLSPVKKMLSEKIEELINAKYLYDVIEVLEEERLIQSVQQLNCESLMEQDQKITLKKYTQEDINRAIENTKAPC